MKWKFWRKDNPLKRLNPHMLAVIMAQRMMDRAFPFNTWRERVLMFRIGAPIHAPEEE